jgi:hypothetical protein
LTSDFVNGFVKKSQESAAGRRYRLGKSGEQAAGETSPLNNACHRRQNMATPIYQLWLVRGYREAFYRLTEAERSEFWAGVEANTKAAGAEHVVICESRWSNEAYAAWGLEVYPDLAARQKATRDNEANQHFRYLEAETCLATKIENFPTSPVDFPNPIYQLTLLRRVQNQPWDNLSPEEREFFWERMRQSIQKQGGAVVIACDTDWSSGEYSAFGITAWPNLEAEQAHTIAMAEMGWHRYIYTKVLLGTTLD